MKKILSILLALALLTPPRIAGATAGGDPFGFLFLDANARAVGMSGAYTAQASDSNALPYNPAGLAQSTSHEVTFMHHGQPLGISQDYVGYSSPRGWGLQVNYLSLGDVQNTTLSDPTGAQLGSTGLTDMLLGAGYGWKVHETLRFGAGAKLIRETIDRYSAQGYALDLGMLYNNPAHPDLRLAAALQNLGPTVKFQSNRESLPLNLRLGAAYDIVLREKEHTVSLDLMKERSDGVLLAVGAETHVLPQLPLRLGLNTRNDAGPSVTMGLGWIYRGLKFDYAFVPYGDIGISHRFSLTARWQGGLAAARKSARPVRRKEPRHAAPAQPFDLVDEFIGLGMLDAAGQELRSIRARLDAEDSNAIRYHERKGTLAYLRNDIGEGKREFQEALKLALKLSLGGGAVADAYAGFARCLTKEGHYERALQFFNKALEVGPMPDSRDVIIREIRKLERRKTLTP